MHNSLKQTVLLILTILFLSACGQKGPLFLPGEPSAIRTTVPQQQQQPQTEENEEDEENEVPTTNQQ